jgi:putative phosphoesterase
MWIGFVSDAHGNPTGLSVCLEYLRAQGTDKICFLGDAVGYMPDWAGVFALLDEYQVECLRGNHDQMAIERMIDTQKNLVYQITPELIDANAFYLLRAASWPTSISMEIGQKELLLVHGSPSQALDGYVYPDSSVKDFESIKANTVFMGNTHRPFVRRVYGKCLVNVGSCGLPRDVGNLASCAIYDVERDECMVYRIPFDAEQIIRVHKDELHRSVIDCLRRRTGNYFGIPVK